MEEPDPTHNGENPSGRTELAHEPLPYRRTGGLGGAVRE